MVDNKDIVKDAFQKILENEYVDESLITHFFSPEYTQHVDGHTIGFHEFIRHMYAQKNVVKKMRVEFLSLISEGNTVFSKHIVTSLKKDGSIVITKVIAEFILEKGKIIACDELTYMLSGTEQDKDLGSRH